MTGNSEIRNLKQDKFWLVGQNRAVLTEGNIVQIVVSGPQDHDIAFSHLKLHQQLTKLVNNKIGYEINLDDAGKFSSEARKIWSQLGDRADTLRIAFTGSHPVARVLADFIISASGKPNMRFFEIKEEAMAWLKETINHSGNID